MNPISTKPSVISSAKLSTNGVLNPTEAKTSRLVRLTTPSTETLKTRTPEARAPSHTSQKCKSTVYLPLATGI